MPRAEALSPDRVRSLRRALLAWYARERRPLPWRESADPYRVWISEAMLQQTRVGTALPYYRRFVERFPTVRALARARPEHVLTAWSGLGYYRRASSLQAAARAIVGKHGGVFPRDRESLTSLPGIGPYTAGAIASIAFGLPEPVVDGNVARVLCRLFGLEGDPTSAGQRRALWSLAGALVPPRGAGEWNQALMELGALVCTPVEARCSACPVGSRCAALRQGRVGELPRRRPRPKAVPVEAVVIAVGDRDRLLLERRPAAGRMAGMWQLPTFEISLPGARGAGRGVLFPRSRPRGLREQETLGVVRHTITHHRIRAVVKRGRLAPEATAPPLDWHRFEDLEKLPLTGMTRKCLAAILAPRQGPTGDGTGRARSTSCPPRRKLAPSTPKQRPRA